MKKEKIEIDFALSGIRTEQFAMLENNYNPKKKDFDYVTTLKFKLDQENKIIGIFIEFEFEQANKVFIKIIVSCHFTIADKSWACLINKSKIKIIFPKTFIDHLALLTLSTTRGVLSAKTEGTQFSTFIIPLINVADIIKEDAIFELNKS
jgi:hypothetical protein